MRSGARLKGGEIGLAKCGKSVGCRLEVVEDCDTGDAEEVGEFADLDLPREINGRDGAGDIRSRNTETCNLERDGEWADPAQEEGEHLLKGAVVGAAVLGEMNPCHLRIIAEKGYTEVGPPEVTGKN